MTTRGTSNTNDRGSSYDRAARRAHLKRIHDAGHGCVWCFWCGRKVRKWEVDRWPLCGHAGGRYTRNNIVPACPACNRARGHRCQRGLCSCGGSTSGGGVVSGKAKRWTERRIYLASREFTCCHCGERIAPGSFYIRGPGSQKVHPPCGGEADAAAARQQGG
jgi:hypothetical protein